MLVLLADELDYLFTRSQQVIYKLLDWPQSPFSHLVVIVAMIDTIDYPNRAFPTPSIYRSDCCRCATSAESPCTASPFVPIRDNRSPPSSMWVLFPRGDVRTGWRNGRVFSREAVDLCSRKVSAVSGDVRRALAIARWAFH